MANTWVCGDTHGHLDLHKFHPDFWPEGYEEGKGNVLIVAGDLGVHWTPIGGDDEQMLMQYWAEKPFTTLWIDGNHENFETIKRLPLVHLHELPSIEIEARADTSPVVGKSGPNLYHLHRGGIYHINGLNIFFMGGGSSIDKNRRREGVSWWPEELPSVSEMQFAIDNVKAFYERYPGEKIDNVVTHTIPFFLRHDDRFIRKMAHDIYEALTLGSDDYKGREEKGLQTCLGAVADEIADHQESVNWFFGHWHKDIEIDMEHRGKTIRFKGVYNGRPTLIQEEV